MSRCSSCARRLPSDGQEWTPAPSLENAAEDLESLL
eukprot:CAMPEP_0174299114 /NCGR_PEP_ID=MMETSP0809-20121228/55772_1 /TAXON_ID=73025 ORGANISM="Eutreptiella gymnastica-like, Strain CCMP1594" /NCGR_SAMPLE_ID=MMETSP0809 /ASSEMBLY_ACC=CAM_ASM_000658 /LENGTH=35 /DNA_ID= /DNA_START= /DNA_END= /DNA_ORIENTATION=